MGILIEDYCDSVFNDTATFTKVIDHPNFMICFQYSILQWFPLSCLLLFILLESVRYTRSNGGDSSKSLPWSGYNITKIAITSMLILIHLTQIIVGCLVDVEDDEDLQLVFGVNFLFSLLSFTAHTISLGMLWLSIKFGRKSSPSIFVFLMASVTSGIIHYPFIAETSNPYLIMFTIHFLLSFILLFQNCFADKGNPLQNDDGSSQPPKPCPKLESSFLSHLLFAWVTPLIWKGFKTDLQLADLWPMEPSLTSKRVIPRFDKKFGHIGNDRRETKTAASVTFEELDTNRFKDMRNMNQSKRGKDQSKSLFPALVKTFGLEFFMGAFMEAINVSLSMVSPQILKMMIAFIQNDEGSANSNDYKAWKGYFLGSILLATTIFLSLLRCQYQEKMFCIAMNVRTAIISTIYRKSIRISNTARKDSTTGEIVNLMAIDAQRFMVSIYESVLSLSLKS